MSLSVARALFARRRSVHEEWSAWLPPEKSDLFQHVRTRWERSFTISAIALHEAFDLRDAARYDQARLHVQMASALVDRNTAEVIRAIQIIHSEARHIGDLPEVEPLDPLNFRTEAAQNVAHWNAFFHWVLFDARSRFFQKLRLLESVTQDASTGFAASADELTESALSDLEAPWVALADLECDLNTSAREVEVVFKAFLHKLPPALTSVVREQLEAPVPEQPRRSRARSARVSR